MLWIEERILWNWCRTSMSIEKFTKDSGRRKTSVFKIKKCILLFKKITPNRYRLLGLIKHSSAEVYAKYNQFENIWLITDEIRNVSNLFITQMKLENFKFSGPLKSTIERPVFRFCFRPVQFYPWRVALFLIASTPRSSNFSW